MRRTAAATLLVAVAVIGCSGDQDPASSDVTRPPVSGFAPDDRAARGSPSPSATEEAMPRELQRTWVIRLHRDQIRADLAAAGYGRWADRFFASEGLAPRVRMALTYGETTFELAWREAGGDWTVGWWGTARVEDGVLTMHDTHFLIDDSYDWRIRDDHLVLSFRSTTGTLVRGIPSEVYSRAYFSRPIPAGGCVPPDLETCL